MSNLAKTEHQGGFSGLLARLETLTVSLASVALVAIMLVVTADVSMRYILHRPLGWSYDLIGTYLMVCVFFFALSDTLNHHGHIAIDVFIHALPKRFIHLSLAVGFALSAVLLAMIAYQGWYRTVSAYTAHNLISVTMPWPTWPSYFLIVVGSVLMTLRLALRAVAHAASCITGREIADMPPPPITAPTESEHGT